MRRVFTLCMLVIAAVQIGGCSGHHVRGVVLVGENSYVQIVDKNDPRLSQGEPVMGATVTSIVDPQSLDSTRLAGVTTDVSGAFSIPVENFGAGWLEYEMGVTVRRSKFAPAEGFFPLPGSGKRVLVVLAPGRDAVGDRRSAFDEDYSFERDLERFAH